MSTVPPLPLCFVAMPFGRKSPPGVSTPVIDFDAIYTRIEQSVKGAGLECIRADHELMGGFIQRPMYERLLVAEYVVADLTFANPNVAYEVGVRHGASVGATVLVCASLDVGQLGFDFRPFRLLTYEVAADGSVSQAALNQFVSTLADRLLRLRQGEEPKDNPILQVTRIGPGIPTAHEKTDVFLQRMKYASEVGRNVTDAIADRDRNRALVALDNIQDQVLARGSVVTQLYTALIALFLGYREKEAYDRMLALQGKLPAELQATTVVREQLALALNRLAEQSQKDGQLDEMRSYRVRAIGVLEEIPKDSWSSETYGILGRIHKGTYDAATAADDAFAAEAALKAAIGTYESGFRADPRDYYPGVNAVMLRALRGNPEDEKRLARLVPVVRFAVERAPAPTPDRPAERYWQTATCFVLACIERDWPAATESLETLVGYRYEPWMQPWMYTTTANDLRKLRHVRRMDEASVSVLDRYITQMGAAAKV